LLPLISESAGRHEQLSLLELSFVAIAAAGALLAWRGGRAQAHERVAWLGYAALAAGFTASVWAEDKAFMRALTEFYLLSALAVLGGHWVVRLLVLGAAGITWSELAVWLARL
jgi:hypothetical protein